MAVLSLGPNDITISLSAPISGTGTEGDPYILTSQTIGPFGASVQSANTITFTGQPLNTDVIWTDNSAGAGTRF